MSYENVVFVRTSSKSESMTAFLKPYIPYLRALNPINVFGYDLLSNKLKFPGIQLIADYMKLAGGDVEIMVGPCEEKLSELEFRGLSMPALKKRYLNIL